MDVSVQMVDEFYNLRNPDAPDIIDIEICGYWFILDDLLEINTFHRNMDSYINLYWAEFCGGFVIIEDGEYGDPRFYYYNNSVLHEWEFVK